MISIHLKSGVVRSLINFVCIVFFLCFYAYSIAVHGAGIKKYEASEFYISPFSSENTHQKNILVYIDQSLGMLDRAYTKTKFDADSKSGLVGYFEADKQYRYHKREQYFEADRSLTRGQAGAWDGQFLNWLLMRKIDMAKLLLLGNQSKEYTQSFYISLNPSSESKVVLQSSVSGFYSPIPNFIPITLNRGKLFYQGKSLQLRIKSDKLEKGLIDLLVPSINLYVYSNKGEATIEKEALANFFKHWKPASSQHGSQSDQAMYKSRLVYALETLRDKAQADQVFCQQYVNLILAARQLLISEAIDDCQPDLKGEQALKSFQWLPFGGSNLLSSKNNRFAYAEKDNLLRHIFRRLYDNDQYDIDQVTGVDMETFTDNAAILYQSLSHYGTYKTGNQINWHGDVRAMFIDERGLLRSDNGDKKLGSLSEDPLVSSCFDHRAKQLRFRFLKKDLPEEKCNSLNYPNNEEDVGYLWRASDALQNLTEFDVLQQRIPYSRNDKRRYIRTHIGQDEYDFVQGEDYPLKPEWLNIHSERELSKLINYVRGEDQSYARNRLSGRRHYLIGDTAKTSPVVVGPPTANYHFLYGDESYQMFLKQYQDRRSRVFIGANDGMIHSFNAGWYDAKQHQLKPSKKHLSEWRLGQEIWAFVPYSVLPYLSELRDRFYGISPEHHLSLFMHKPYIFDAKVFGQKGLIGQENRLFKDENGNKISSETHPSGWGTIMVIGAGLGAGHQGGFKPSYLVFDITDAEQAPKLLAELSPNAMGNAISLPSVMTRKNQQGEISWHLVIGSGVDIDPRSLKGKHSSRPASIYLYDLESIESTILPTSVKRIQLHSKSSYVAGITSVDWNFDGGTDALYVNTSGATKKQNGQTKQEGSLYRVYVSNRPVKHFDNEKILKTDLFHYSAPQVSLDNSGNRWIYVSASSYLAANDLAGTRNKVIGIKEPRNSKGDFLVELSGGKSGGVSENSILDVSDVLVDASTGELTGKWNIYPKLPEKTAHALEQRLIQFSDASRYISGWVRQLDKHEIINGDSKLFGGILTQTSYKSEYLNCQLSRQAYVHRLRYTTGTAWLTNQSVVEQGQNKAGTLLGTRTEAFGSSILNSILLHAQGQNVRQIQTSKNGKTQTNLEQEYYIPMSGEVSWREL